MDIRILVFRNFFIMWFVSVCIKFTHNYDTEKNNANNSKIYVELYYGEDEDDEYEAEQIVSKKIHRCKALYLVRWKGYSGEDDKPLL